VARFDIYCRTGGSGYLIDIQDNLLRDLNTRIVAPLLSFSEAPNPAQRLNPVFEIEGERYTMVTQFLGLPSFWGYSVSGVTQFLVVVPVTELGRRMGTLIDEDTRIIAAIDTLFSGT